MGAPGIGLRLFGRLAPKVVAAGAKVAPFVEGMTPMARRVATFHPEAAPIAEAVVAARDAGLKRAGTVIADALPTLEALSPAESTGLAQVLLGRIPPQQAATALTPRTVDLLRRGAMLAKESGRPFGGALRAAAPALSSKAARNGAALFQQAIQNEAEPITQRIVQTQLRPMAAGLQDETARHMADQLLSAVERGGGGTGSLQTARAFQTATLLGRAVILNAGQGVGMSGVVAGAKPSLLAMRDMMTAAGRAKTTDLALRTGTSLDTALTDYLQKDLGTGGLAKFSSEMLRKTGFNMVERFNRRYATAVGSHWFDELAQLAPNSTAAQKQLLRHGVRDPLAADARDKFLQSFVRRTQFRLTPEELPAVLSMPGTRGEVVKTLFQFKPFAYKATEMMLDELKANPGGFLARSVGFGLPVGGALSELRHATGGSKRERGPTQRTLEAIMALGVGGMFYDFVQASQGGAGKVTEMFTGPTLGMLAEGAEAGMRTLQGRPSKLGRMVVRRIPIVGPKLAGQMGGGGGGRKSQSILPQ